MFVNHMMWDTPILHGIFLIYLGHVYYHFAYSPKQAVFSLLKFSPTLGSFFLHRVYSQTSSQRTSLQRISCYNCITDFINKFVPILLLLLLLVYRNSQFSVKKHIKLTEITYI